MGDRTGAIPARLAADRVLLNEELRMVPDDVGGDWVAQPLAFESLPAR